MEEDVLDSHKLVLDQIPKWHQACATLLAMTNEVDYDVDGTVRFFLPWLCFILIELHFLPLTSLRSANGRHTSRGWRRIPEAEIQSICF